MQNNNVQVNFDDTRKAFAYKNDVELKKAKFLFNIMQWGPLVKIGSLLTPFLIKSGFPIKKLIKKTIFEQFVGGESLEKTSPVCEKLEKYHVDVILDYGIEGGEYTDDECDEATQEFIKVIDYAALKKNIPFISIKVTGISSISLLEKLNLTIGKKEKKDSFIDFDIPLSLLNESDKIDWEKLIVRMKLICAEAHKTGIGVMIDAEESWIQDPIDYIARLMMKEYNLEKTVVFNTVQLYRTDRLAFLKDSAEHAEKNNYALGVKLVRGAYMEKETKRALKIGYTNPIQVSKKNTDDDYNLAVAYCLNNLSHIKTIVASHNEKSNLGAANFMIQKENPKHPNLHFSQLYGMSDNLTFNLADAGFNVSKYLPFGPLEEVVPYLMRRAQENSSISGQTTRELDLIKKECIRRNL
jgi:proline dehydrogenase